MIKQLAALVLLVACAQPFPPPVAPPAVSPPQTEDSCNAAQYSGLVGQDATALERELIMGPVRVIRPGMAVTMDFSPTRINFAIDEANRISGITCG
jgi:hypothetical protein